MESHALKLYIVDDDKPMAVALKNYLQSKFGRGLRIFLFQNGEKCLQSVDDETDMVVMDPDVDKAHSLELLQSIKEINPNTEVVMFSNNDDIVMAIESYRKGAADSVAKDEIGMNKIAYLVDRLIRQPILRIFREFSVRKFTVIFLTTFLVMGIVVWFFLKVLHVR